jgi:hypothetical protein
MNIQYSLLMGLMLFLMAGYGESKKSEASPGVQTGFWPTSTFEQEGLREEPINTLLAEINKGTYGYVDEMNYNLSDRKSMVPEKG